VSRTASPFQWERDLGRLDERRIARWIYFVLGRGKHAVDRILRQRDLIGPEVTRISLVIFPRLKLDRIDENRDDRKVTFAGRGFNQGEVSPVKSAHRGDKPDRFARLSGRTDGAADLAPGGEDRRSCRRD
jgi:hypothetical protein